MTAAPASLVAIASRLLPFSTDGASVGITSVLVLGAGTHYALLLIARYREELRTTEDRYVAMRHAVDHVSTQEQQVAFLDRGRPPRQRGRGRRALGSGS